MSAGISNVLATVLEKFIQSIRMDEGAEMIAAFQFPESAKFPISNGLST